MKTFIWRRGNLLSSAVHVDDDAVGISVLSGYSDPDVSIKDRADYLNHCQEEKCY